MNPSRRPLTVEDLWRLRRIGPFDAAPDGTRIVAAVATPDMETNEISSRLVRFDEGGEGVPLTRPETHSTSPKLDPSGNRVAFIRRDENKKGQLAVLPLGGGEAEILTDLPLGIQDPRWFPDGKRIAFLAEVLAEAPTPDGTRELLKKREQDPVQVHVTEDRVYRYWDRWLTDGRIHHLFVIDLETRVVTDLIPDSRRWFDFMDPAGSYDISPDGSRIAFSADRSEPPHSPTNWDVFLVDTAGGGQVRNLTEGNPADDLRPRFSPGGGHLLYGMQRELDFYADRVRLAVCDLETGEHRVLTEDWDRSASGWEFTGRDDEVLLLAEDDARVALFRTSLEGGTPAEVARGGTLSGLRPLADGGALAVRSDLSSPPDLVRIAPGGGVERISAVNDELLAGVEMGEVREITFPGAEGASIQAFVVLPPGFDPDKKWPLLNVVHGGPHGMFGDQFHFRWNFQLLAAPGYVVVSPNFHGSTSWGQDFAASIQGAWGDRPYTDAMASVDAVLAEGYVDPARMAVAGGSYGGYLASWIASRTDRFACVINHAGVVHNLAQYASDVTYGRARAFGGEPWDGLENLERWSPVRFAQGFRSPMLVLHGERDYRVPVTQGLTIYNIYRAMDLPARLVHFPDENHWILKPRNAQLWYREFHGWLERWVGAGPDAGPR